MTACRRWCIELGMVRLFELVDDGGARQGVATKRELWMPSNPDGTRPSPERLDWVVGVQARVTGNVLKALKFEPMLHIKVNARSVFTAPLFSCFVELPIRFAVAGNDEVEVQVVALGEARAPVVGVALKLEVK